MIASTGQCGRLFSVLSSRPELVPIITKIHVIDAGWACKSSEFPSTLQTIADAARLVTFHFQLPRIHTYYEKDVGFPKSGAMTNIFTSPSLKNVILAIPLCSFPLELFTVTPSLQSLRVTGSCLSMACDMSVVHHDDSPPSPPPSYLKTLDVRCAHSARILQYFWESLSQLRGLKMAIAQDDELSLLWEVMKAASDTLVTLHWDDTMLRFKENPIRLHLLPNLRLVVFEFYDIMNRLNILAESGLPRSLEIFVPLIPSFAVDGFAPHLGMMDERLAALFTSTDAFPQFHGVHVVVAAEDHEPVPGQAAVERRFPILRKAGLLKIVIGSQEEVNAVLKVMETDVQR